MVKYLILGTSLWLGCGGSPTPNTEHGLILHGFRLVDPSDHSVREADVCLEHGVVCAAPSPGAHYARIEGQGRFLLPAFWDLNAALWGNNSAKNYEQLSQDMAITQCLRVELYYGVAHVAAFGMEREWIDREIERAHALEFPAAELLYPDKALGGAKAFSCVAVHSSSQLPALLDERSEHGAPYVQLFYTDPNSPLTPGLSQALLKEALAQAARRKLKGYVFVDDWQHARTAAELGASLIYGLPDGPLSDDLVQYLVARGVAYAPALTAALELPRVLGDRAALSDPFLGVSVASDVLTSFRDPKGLWVGWQSEYEQGQRKRAKALGDLRRLADAGVHIVQVSDAGWTSGTFQGYSSHAFQGWLEQAGVSAWTRLAAATTWPAELVARRVGFAPGEPGDFVALDENPLERAANLRSLSLIIREGKLVDRARLKPDLSRHLYRP